jgi:hypothetical protein
MWRDNANRRIPVSHKYPLGIEPGSLMTDSKRVDHWTGGTVYECSEVAGSPHYFLKKTWANNPFNKMESFRISPTNYETKLLLRLEGHINFKRNKLIKCQQ